MAVSNVANPLSRTAANETPLHLRHHPFRSTRYHRPVKAALNDPHNAWRWYLLAKSGLSERDAITSLVLSHGTDPKALTALSEGYFELKAVI